MYEKLYYILLSMLWISAMGYFYAHNNEKSKLKKSFILLSLTSLAGVFIMLRLLDDNWWGLFVRIGTELLPLPIVIIILHERLKNVIMFLLISGFISFYFAYSNAKFLASYFTENTKSEPPKHAVDHAGEWLVCLSENSNIEQFENILKKHSAKSRAAFTSIKNKDITDLDQYFIVDIDNIENYHLLLKELQNAALIAHWEWNEKIFTPTTFPSNPNSTNKSNTCISNDSLLAQQWALESLVLNDIYKILQENKPSRIPKLFILDTGIDGLHPDLKDNYLSTDKKYDTDVQGHGTHCAGIAGAVSNNQIGIASLWPQSKWVEISSIKVLSDQGWGTQEDIINGIILATDMGADVISLSLGGPSSDYAQRAYESAVAYANQAGAIVVVAAGNESTNAKEVVPASVKGVITVSAIDQANQLASFSNHVDQLEMGIAAPGVDILSTFPNGQYQALSGTSMATPYLAACVALLKAFQEDLDTKGAYQILSSTGKTLESKEKSGQLVQPAKALANILGLQ